MTPDTEHNPFIRNSDRNATINQAWQKKQMTGLQSWLNSVVTSYITADSKSLDSF
jgi:hypothetical protein